MRYVNLPMSKSRVAVLLSTIAILIIVGRGVMVAKAEEKVIKVLTVEKLGAGGGANAEVNDSVAVKVSGLSFFEKTDGKVRCSESEIAGKIETNPQVGKGNAVIKIEKFTFNKCTSTVVGWETVKSVAVETLPLKAETQGATKVRIFDGTLNMGVEIALENAAKEEMICIFRATPLMAGYSNAHGELYMPSGTVLGGLKNKKRCGCPPPPKPTWHAFYEPLNDETGVRAGKQIVINE